MLRNIEYNFNHVNGLFFELLSDEGHNSTYTVKFIDRLDDSVVHEQEMKTQTWVRLDRRYLSDIVIKLYFHHEVDEEVFSVCVLDLIRNKKVFITFDSESLGDTLAWLPSCEYFRTQYNCKVVVSTFKNDLFKRYYPNMTFVGRGVTVNNLAGMFELGWFFDANKEPVNPVTISLQQTANNILCINPKEELIPKLDFIPNVRPIADKYVCISTKSTAHLKLWYYWEEVIAHLLEKGFKVVEISKDETNFVGTEVMSDKSLQSTMNYIYHAEYFLGLSSGLSWLSWALGQKVFMIANFSNKDHEFQTNIVRITNQDVCNSCWNNPVFQFNRGDFMWCPEHEDTSRQFECHKSITAKMVIDVLN